MKKRILVPVDFSEQSENALKTAVFYNKTYGYEIVVVHMLELSGTLTNGAQSAKETVFYLKYAEKQFNEFLDKDYLKDVEITPVIKHYKVFSELNELCKEEKIDLIMMGSKGVSGFKEVFVGSNTQKVIRHSDVPVMVVKDKAITNGFKKAIFACDFTDDSIGPYIRIKRFCEFLNLKTKMLYVNTPTKAFKSTFEIKEKVKEFFQKAYNGKKNSEKVHYVSDYSIEAGITNFAKNCDADLIIMATHGRKGFSYLFDHSATEDVANHSPIPVVSFKILPKHLRKKTLSLAMEEVEA